MDNKVKLTPGRIREFVCEADKSQAFLWDSEVKGLAVRVTPSGVKSFIFQGKLNSKTIRVTIGDVRAWDIESGTSENPGAREEARRLQTLIDRGIDPRQDEADKLVRAEEQRKEAERRDLTVGELWPIYIEARRPRWSERHLADHQNLADPGGGKAKKGDRLTEPGALASFMRLRLSDITKEKVKAWLAVEGVKRPTQAALAFRLLRAFLNWCEDIPEYSKLATPDACGTRVVRDLLPKQKPKVDCLHREQLNAWFSAVRRIKNPIIASYLQALLLTGARREELINLKWSDVDFQWNGLAIRDKVEGERMIPLTPFVRGLLLELKRRNDAPPTIATLNRTVIDQADWKPSQWVFSSRLAESGRLQEPGIQHRAACAAAAIEGLTLHGLRRSFKSLSEWLEMPAGIVAQLMGHKPSATAEKHYTVRPVDLLRKWHSTYEAWILEQADIEQPKEGTEGLRAVK